MPSKHDGTSASGNLKFAVKKGKCCRTILDYKILNTDGLK